jgi:hypothetical protein
VEDEGFQEFGRGKRPLASMRFERWITEPERCQVPMKRPCVAVTRWEEIR